MGFSAPAWSLLLISLLMASAAARAPAPATAPAAPARRALSDDAALDTFVASLAHEGALDTVEPMPALAPAIPALGSSITRRHLLDKVAKAPSAMTAAMQATGAYKHEHAVSGKPMASAEAPVTAPFGEPAPAARPARRSLSEVPMTGADPDDEVPVLRTASAIALAGQVAPQPLATEDPEESDAQLAAKAVALLAAHASMA